MIKIKSKYDPVIAPSHVMSGLRLWNLNVTCTIQEPRYSSKGPAEGAIGSNVIIALVVEVMATTQKRRETDFVL